MSGNGHPDERRDSILAGICAGLLIACLVAGKATRDALFLSTHSVAALPTMIVVAALASLVVVVASMRLMVRHGPRRVMPRALLVSAIALLLITALARFSPRWTAIAFYLHFTAFGAVLVSGFWSLINERFDPRTARQRIGRIGAGGAAGGLLGGLLAERIAALWVVDALIPSIAIMQLACAVLLIRIARNVISAPDGEDTPGSQGDGLEAISRNPYLRNLAGLVMSGAVAAICLDYIFKSWATTIIGSGEDLLRYFALFYTGVGLASFLLQAGLAKRALERLGLANTVASLPIGVALGGGLNLMFPGLGSATGARGAEASLRNSLFRSGYEPLFIPLPVHQKRRAKQFIDVGCERLGDALGGGLVALVLFTTASSALQVLAALAVLLGLLGIWISLRVHDGWVRALEGSLESRAAALDMDEHDEATRTMVFRTIESLDIRPPGRRSIPEREGPAPLEEPDQDASALLILRGRQLEPVRRLLVRTPTLPREWIGHVIPLLAWDDVTDVAAQALRGVATDNVGQILDHLLDPEEDFAVRRRLPPIIAGVDSQRAVDGLLGGLGDRRFEVRYQCGRALLRIHTEQEALAFDSQRLFDVIRMELQVERRVWEGHRLIDQLDADFEAPFDKDVLRRRSGLGLEHVFALLGIVLPAKPVSIAYQGLFTEDRALRGTSLEYLESVLPEDIRARLWPFLNVTATQAPSDAQRDQILEKLMQSRASIQISIDQLEKE
jgi:MFS family permease